MSNIPPWKPQPPPPPPAKPVPPPTPANCKLQPPKWLRPVAREEFIRVAIEIDRNSMQVDLSLVADYARLYGELVELQEEVDNLTDWNTYGPNGSMYTHPTVTQRDRIAKDLAILRRDLYFTPKSRTERLSKKKTGLRDQLDR